MALMTPQAILFDWDNTLVDTWPTIYQALHDTFVDFDMEPWSFEEVKLKVARSMRESFPELFGARWEEAGKTYQDHYKSYNLEKLVELEGAEETLKWLRDAGIPIGLVSNKRGPTLRDEVAHIGWGHYFGAQLGAGDAEADKPSPAPIHKALIEMDFEETTPIWYIGDSGVDLEVAANTGALPIFFGEKTTSPAADGTGEYEGHAFARHAKTHGELLNLFKQELSIEC